MLACPKNRGIRTPYAATVLRLRFPPESTVPAETVSIHGGDWRYESSAVIAGISSFLPMARPGQAFFVTEPHNFITPEDAPWTPDNLSGSLSGPDAG